MANYVASRTKRKRRRRLNPKKHNSHSFFCKAWWIWRRYYVLCENWKIRSFSKQLNKTKCVVGARLLALLPSYMFLYGNVRFAKALFFRFTQKLVCCSTAWMMISMGQVFLQRLSDWWEDILSLFWNLLCHKSREKTLNLSQKAAEPTLHCRHLLSTFLYWDSKNIDFTDSVKNTP